MAVNARQYIKNVGKSFGYLAADYFGTNNPAVKSLIDSTKEATNELKSAIDDIKDKAKEGSNEKNLLAEPIQVGKDFIGNFISDIKSGKWYNKERSNEYEEKLAKGFIGDMDFDFDDDFDTDFDMDFDVDDDDDSDIDMAKTVDTVGSKVSEAVSMATAKSAQYIVSSSSRNTRAMMEQNNRLFLQVNTGISSINNNLMALVRLGTDVNTHIQNSGVFYTKSTELQTKQVELLEKLVKNTSPVENKVETRKSSATRISNLLGSDDILDFVEYFKAIKDNIKNEVSFLSDMNNMFKNEDGGGESILGQIAASPVKMILSTVVEGLIPQVLKDSMENFNETLSGFFGGLLQKLNNASSDNFILDKILDILHIDNRLKKSLDPSLYKKDKVDFDGITRKSIVEVIPTYLSKILASLNGKDEMRYDYEQGVFRSVTEIKKAKDDIVKNKAKSIGYDIKELFEEYVSDLPDKEELLRNLDNYFVKAIEKNDKIEYRQTSRHTKDYFKEFGLDERTGKLLVETLTKAAKDGKTAPAANFSKETMLARESITDEFKRIEEKGGSILNYLFDNSIDKDNIGTLTSSPLNLNNIYDQYHNNIFYYLQGIWQFTGHISDNIQNIGGGGGPSSPKGPRGPKGKGGTSRVFEKMRDIQDNTPKKEAPKAKQFTKYEYEEYIKDIKGYYTDKGWQRELKFDSLRRHFTKDEDKKDEKLKDIIKDKDIKTYEEFTEMSQEERDKYLSKLADSKKKIKDAEKNKDKEEKEPKTWFGRMVQSIKKVATAPGKAAADILNWGSNKMLDVLYGKDRDPDKGFMDILAEETKDVFNKFKKWIDDNILKKFDLGTVDDYIDKLFGKKGEDGKRHGGWFGKVGNNIAEDFKSAGRWVKNIFTDGFGAVKDFFTGGSKTNAATGGNVTKTGLVAVSEGELIIPSELNPYYKGKTDKSKQRRDESNIVKRFYGKFEDGGVGGDKKGTEEFKKDKEEANKENTTKAEKIKGFFSKAWNKFTGTEEDPGLGRDMFNTTKDGASKVYDQLFGKRKKKKGKDNDKTDEKKTEDKVKKTIGTVLKELGVPDKFSSVITGNIIGGGISLLTGGIISPMLGAAIGGAVGLTLKSKKVQTALFGGKDENGEDVEGLLPKKVADFIQKYIPSMAKLGVVGGASGLLGLIPGGPVAGIVVGSALGYAIKTEKFKDWLFGNEDKGIDGVINKELQEKIKKAVPNIATGALVGLTVGPFGIVGNLLVGSALGYATTTEKFKEKMFGKDGEGGGILTMIREKVLDPLQETIQAVAHEISFQMKKMFKSTTSMLKKAFEDMILLPIQKAVKDLLLKPFGKIAKGLLAIPTFLVGGAFKAVTGLGGLLKRKQIRKGQASYMTAQERLDYREEKGMGNEDRTFKFDEMVSNMSEDEVKQFRESVKGVQDPTKDLRKKSQKALNNITGALSADDKLTTREIYKITKKIKDGKTDKAMADIDEYGKKRGMSNKEIESLKEKVLNNANEYNSLKEKKKDVSSYTKEKLKEIEKKYGIKINQKNAWQYEDLLKGELKGRAKYEEAKSPEQKMMDQNEKHHNEIIENMKEIINGINNIANGVPPTSNKKEEEFLPPAVVEDIKEKTNSTNPFDDKTDNESDNDDEYSGNIFERIKQVTSRKNGFTLTDLINAIKGKKKEKKEHINVDPLNDIIDASSFADETVKEAFDKVRNDAEDAEFKEVAEEKSGNILDKIAGFFNGKNIKVSANKDSGIYKFFEKFGKSKKDKEEENVRYTSTATGELLKNVKNGQGEWELDRTDKETNDIIEQQRAVQEAQISTSKHLGGLGGTLGDLFSKLFHKDEDKPTLLDKIKEKLFDGFDFIKDKLGGTVNNILNFFTGGNLSSLIGTAAGTIVTAIGAGLVIKAFLGSEKIENFVETIVNGITGQDKDEPESAKGNTTFSDKRTSSIDINGKTTKILVDKNGNPEKDGDGNYVDAKGNIIDGSSDQWVTEEKSGRTLQSRLFENTARSVVGGKFVKDATGKIVGFTPKAGVATTVAKKVAGDKGVQAIGKGVSKAAKVTKNIATKAGKKIASSKAGQAVKKGAAKVVDKIAGKGVAEAAANQGLYKGFMKMISNALEKIPTILSKIPFLKRFADKADDIVTLLYTKLDDAAIKLASSSGKMLGNLASTMSTALVVLKVVFIVADFYTGYQDARTTLGIVDKPTEGQRLISGLIRVIKNLIPVISALIPDKALVSLFVNKIAPLLGIDVSDLKEQRKEAKEKVDAYNKKHGTDYNIEDYNKKVLKDYTITEKAGNFVRSVKKNIKEKGVVGAIKSGTQEYVEDKVDTFKKNFEKGGPVQAIAETVGSILPGYIGDGAKGTVYMAEMALKGKVKEVFSYTPTEDKNANMLTKILGQVSVLVPKLALTPVALISAGIRKVLGFLNLDNLDSLKEIGKDIGSVFKNAFTGNIMDMYKVNGGAKGDSTFASIFKNIALAIPKVALTPVSLITTGIRKLLEVLGIDSLGDVLDMGKDVIDMGKYAFTGQIRKLSSVGSDNGDNEKGGIAKWFKKFATFIPKMGFMPVALITTGIRKVLELLGIESFGDVLDIGKDIGSIFKNAFTGKLGDMYATDRSDKNDNAFLKFTKNLALAPPKLVMTPIALITTGIRKILEALNLDSFADILDLGKDIGSIYKNAFTGKIGDMYSIGSRNKEDSPFASTVKNIGLAMPKIALTPVALITTGIRKVLEALGIESFGDVLDIGKDVLTIGKYAFTGRIKEMYAMDRSGENDNMFLKFTKNLALAIPKVAATPIALITTGVRKVLEALNLDSISDVVNIGADILTIGKYAVTGKIGNMWKTTSSNEEDSGFATIFKNAALSIPKVLLTPIALITTGVRKALELLGLNSLDSVFDLGKDFLSVGKNAITGKIGAMYKVGNRNADTDGKFANVFKNIALGIPKIAMTPIALITTGVRKVLEILNLDSFADILDLGGDLLDIGKYAITGRIGDMYKVGSSNEEDSAVARVIKNAALSIPKVIMTPVAAVTSAVRFIGEKITDAIGFIKKAVDMDGIKDKLSKVKSLEDLWKIKNTVDEKNNFKILNTVAVGLVKIVYTPMMIVKKIVNLFPNLIDKIKEKIGSVWDTVEDFIDDPIATITGKNKKKEKKDKGGNSGLYVGGDSGFVSQNDPQYANNKYGNSNVSQVGCGPAVAAMAVNNAYSGGNVVSMKDSLAYARRKGYEQKDGTTSDYFGDMFDQYGLGSEYIDNGNGSKSKAIQDRLASGSSVVLLGRDAKNTSKANSPFGPNNHYVLATGLDKKGNVIVNDPEMNHPTVYSNKILDNSNLAISTTGSGSRIKNRINKANRFKVYIGGASSTEKQIFNFLTDKMGLNSAAASGILANIYKESSFNPDTVGDHGTSYGICQWHNGRYTNLRNWCAKNNLDYKTLHGQLCYLNHELTTGYKSMLNKFKNVPDTAEGAYKVGYEWCYSYERPANKQAKSVERGNLAKNTYFPKYKGQKGKYDKDMVISGNVDTSVSSSSSSDTESNNETGFSKLTSLFGGLMGKYYGENNPLGELLGFSSSNSSSGSDSLTTYEGFLEGGPGNAKQKAVVNKMLSKQGQLTYSMKGPRNPDKGSADCSSTVNWAYKSVFGKDIGNNTASILSNDNTQVVYVDNTAKQVTGTSSSKGPIESKLQPGDILLYSRPNSNYTAGRKYRVGHVEMYAGNNKRVGHGGPGPGPKVTPLNRDAKHFIMAKRLKDVGKGSGIYDSRNYINTVHDSGTIVSIGGASKADNTKALKAKASTAAKKLSSKSASDETMIALIKSIVTLLTTMANNTTKINTIVELLQNYFNAKNGNTTTNTKQKSSAKTTKAPNLSTELDTATKELVDYLNSLAV